MTSLSPATARDLTIFWVREGHKVRVLDVDNAACDQVLNELAWSTYRAALVAAGYQVVEAGSWAKGRGK